MAYELLGINDSDDPELQGRRGAHRSSEMTWDASDYFERGSSLTLLVLWLIPKVQEWTGSSGGA
jgi:hypothetical protein